MDLKTLVSKIEPIIIDAVNRNRTAIISAVGGWQAWALGAVWHLVVSKVLPYAVRVGVQIALTVAAPMLAKWLESVIREALSGRSLIGSDHAALAEQAVNNLSASVGALDDEVVKALRTYGVNVQIPTDAPDPSRYWNGGNE